MASSSASLWSVHHAPLASDFFLCGSSEKKSYFHLMITLNDGANKKEREWNCFYYFHLICIL